MCGIYGRIGPRDDALDQLSTQTLQHRGPDHTGLYIDTRPIAALPGAVVALGHTRLSILDPSPAAHQPMISDDGETVLVFGGEIYNFKALRQAMQAAGETFHTHSDTEVILRLYQREGDAFLSQLQGMFALAIWDRRAGRLLLARDPTGIKPLYVRLGAGQGGAGPVAFASECKALLRDPSFRRLPNELALGAYLSRLYVPRGDSAFEGIVQLRAGERLVWQGGEVQRTFFHRYAIDQGPSEATLSQSIDALDELLTEVTAQHLNADVPVGVFLSGGIDSGLLAALAMKHRRARGDHAPIRAFTLGFRGESDAHDEVTQARLVAESLGLTHRVVRMDGRAMAARVGHIVDRFDEPYGNPTALLQDVICEAARRDVGVVLSGDGGDEAFAGYPRHRAVQAFAAVRSLPAAVRQPAMAALAKRLPNPSGERPWLRRLHKFLNAATGDFDAVYSQWLSHDTPEEQASLLTASARDRHWNAVALAPANAHPSATLLRRACLTDVCDFLPDNVLRHADRMSMGHGLEVRVPLSDHRVVAFGLALPDAHRMTPLAALSGQPARDSSKRVLRHLAERYVPKSIVAAPKQGFVAPLGTWLATDLRDRTVEAITRLGHRGVIRPERADQMMKDHTSKRRD
ncbi:MAG: asparagine synthase (glutamine-hydrolyzing), partial [Myxococcales bacterium]|nr:asparagine synthase (glutamine-hydrolyzing) [Myxococcales bacterium]